MYVQFGDNRNNCYFGGKLAPRYVYGGAPKIKVSSDIAPNDLTQLLFCYIARSSLVMHARDRCYRLLDRGQSSDEHHVVSITQIIEGMVELYCIINACAVADIFNSRPARSCDIIVFTQIKGW